jgi:hypothetical protein
MKTDRFILAVVAASAASWVIIFPVGAQPAPDAAPAEQTAPSSGACQDDLQKFCKDAGAFAARMKCLKEHEADLSSPCKQAREKMAQRAHKRLDKAKESCQSDIEKYCKDVKEGAGRIAACLKGHVDDLSPRCKITYDKIDIQVQKRKIIKNLAEACQDDMARFCKDTPVGKGGRMKCLKEHKEELSDSCKAAMPGQGKEPEAPVKEEATGPSGEQGH